MVLICVSIVDFNVNYICGCLILKIVLELFLLLIWYKMLIMCGYIILKIVSVLELFLLFMYNGDVIVFWIWVYSREIKNNDSLL